MTSLTNALRCARVGGRKYTCDLALPPDGEWLTGKSPVRVIYGRGWVSILDDPSRRAEPYDPFAAAIVNGRAAQVEANLAGGEFVGDVAGIGQGPGEPVQCGDDQGFPGPAGRERFPQARTGAGGAGQTVVDLDAGGVNAEMLKAGPLDGEILFDGGHPRVPDQ